MIGAVLVKASQRKEPVPEVSLLALVGLQVFVGRGSRYKWGSKRLAEP